MNTQMFALRMEIPAILPILLCILSTSAAAEDLIVPQGQTVEISGTNTYEHVNIEGDLVLTGYTEINAMQSFVLDGGGKIRSNLSPGVDGADGEHGEHGDILGNPNGEAGGDGVAGSDGSSQYDLVITVYGDMTLGGIIDFKGMGGGDGGNGGNGGSGADSIGTQTAGSGAGGGAGSKGGDGGNGGRVTLQVFGTLDGETGDIFVSGGSGGSAGNGGRGGSGGDGTYKSWDDYYTCTSGGAPGGPGLPGIAGKGGHGGSIEVFSNSIDSGDWWLGLSSGGGNGGEGGKGGGGGGGSRGGWIYQDYPEGCCAFGASGLPGHAPSHGGGGGDGGTIEVQVSCSMGLVSPNAPGGRGGIGGMGGSPGSTGGNGDIAGCSQVLGGIDGGAGAAGGPGGLGGNISVTASTLLSNRPDYLLARAGGGYGGIGGEGTTPTFDNCASCPESYGGLGAGGGGGPGGDGGTALLLTPDEPPQYTTEALEGLGGEGGEGCSFITLAGWVHGDDGTVGIQGIAGIGLYRETLLDPTVTLLANGMNEAITVAAGEAVSLSLSLDPGTFCGVNSDLWLLALTPAGLYSFSPQRGGWTPGVAVLTQNPLPPVLPAATLPPLHLPAGFFKFGFLADDTPDFSPQIQWFDLVSVTVTP